MPPEREANASRGDRFDSGLYEALLDSAPDAVVVVDEAGTIVLANSRAETLFGYSRGELEGKQVDILVPERYRAKHGRDRTAYQAAPRFRPMGEGLDLFGLRKDGREFPVEISLSPVATPRGSLAAAAIRDVTARKRIEEELSRKNRELQRANEAKDAFVANMSHELRTPLNAVIGFAGTLLMGLAGELTEEQREQLEIIQRNGRHLLSFINDLLDLSRIEAGTVPIHTEEISCPELLEEVADSVRLAAEGKGLAFTVAADGAGKPLTSDYRALRQILLNLCSNAIKFTHSGRVDLGAAQASANGHVVTTFAVADTGIGIESTHVAKVFDAFHQVDAGPQRRYEGAGLGLYISRRLAELIGAELELESAPGVGSTFRVVVPHRP